MSSILAVMWNYYTVGMGQNESGFAFRVFEPYACRTKSLLEICVTVMRSCSLLLSEGDSGSNLGVDTMTNCSRALLVSA